MSYKDQNKFSGINDTSKGVRSPYEYGSSRGFNKIFGVYNAIVLDNADPDYRGHIWVELRGRQKESDLSSESERKKSYKIRQLNPFGGKISGTDYSNNYGSSFPPPSPGTEVLVAFTGNEQEGYLLGVLGDNNRNASVPGIPASQIKGEGDGVIGPALDTGATEEQEGNKRVRHPVANAVAKQGIGYDPVRGIGSSGARRESPSNVAGILTPGGHSFVMDDGTISKKEGSNHVPNNEREAGKNNLIRLRSGSGAQFLINDSAGIVYIINQAGSSWIQLSADGNVDIYSQGSISMHAEVDFNLHVGGDFNLDADGINIKSRGSDGIKMFSATGGVDLFSNRELRLTTNTNMHQRAIGDVRVTSGGMIDLNGPPAAYAEQPSPNNLTTNRGVKESTAGRVPEHEPWGGHAEAESVIHAQAPSKIDNSSADYDLSKSIGETGPSASAGPAPAISSNNGIGPQ